MLFLVDYDRKSGEIVSFRAFNALQQHEAAEARLELELELNRCGINREVVLLDAANEQVLRKTHRRYFATIAELAVVPENLNGNGKPGG